MQASAYEDLHKTILKNHSINCKYMDSDWQYCKSEHPVHLEGRLWWQFHFMRRDKLACCLLYLS